MQIIRHDDMPNNMLIQINKQVESQNVRHLQIEVYTTPTCPDCLALKRWFAQEGLSFTEHDLRRAEVAEEAKRRTGVRVAPVTVIDNEHVFYGVFAEQKNISALLKLDGKVAEA